MFGANTKVQFLSYRELEYKGRRCIIGEVKKPWISAAQHREYPKEGSVTVSHSETSLANLSLHRSDESAIEITGQTIKSQAKQSCEFNKELMNV